MLTYCSQCTPIKLANLDLVKVAKTLPHGESKKFICMGCVNRGIHKDTSGKLFLAKLIDGKIQLHPISLRHLSSN